MKSKEVWLWDGTVLPMTPNSVPVEKSAIGIRDGKIFFLGANEDAKPSAGAEVIDCNHKLILPGFLNGHAHAPMTLLRGFADDLPLEKWLHDTIFPLERKWGKADFVEAGSRLAFLEMIKTGTVLCNDMYYMEEHAAKIAHEAGIRFIAGQTLVEISGVEGGFTGFLDRFEVFLQAVQRYPRVIPAITPHSIYGVSAATWKKLIDYVLKKDIFLHFHLSETEREVAECKERYGQTPVRLFTELGLWKCRTIAAHSVWVDEEEIAILGRHRVPIAHNPDSNLKLGSGIAPIAQLRKAGCPVAIGTDSAASNNNLDLLQEASTGAKLQILKAGPGTIRAQEWLEMLTSEGAKALGVDSITGTLEVGKNADLIVIETRTPQAMPLYHVYSQLIYSLSGNDVVHTMVEGDFLMKDRKVLTLNEEAILEDAEKWGKKISG